MPEEFPALANICRLMKHAGIIAHPTRLFKRLGLHCTAFRGAKVPNLASKAPPRKLSSRK